MFNIGEFIPLDASYYHYEKENEDNYISFVLRDGKILGKIVMGNKILATKVKLAIEKRVNFPI